MFNANIFHSSFFIEFCEAKFVWASRFAPLRAPLVRGRSRRAIRSITFGASPLRWFRYYPSRKKTFKILLKLLILSPKYTKS